MYKSCKYCGYIYGSALKEDQEVSYVNLSGFACINCGEFNEPEKELDIVKMNRLEKEKIKRDVLRKLRLQKGDINANQHK
jgi:hypothetical protein